MVEKCWWFKSLKTGSWFSSLDLRSLPMRSQPVQDSLELRSPPMRSQPEQDNLELRSLPMRSQPVQDSLELRSLPMRSQPMQDWNRQEKDQKSQNAKMVDRNCQGQD